jgi:transposase
VFTEQDEQVARPRALLTVRACWWAINQIRREHASIAGIARQLGTTWNTVWTSIEPLLQAMADDESRFDGVKRLGVDEHVWHHVSEFPVEDGGRGPKQLTGMVDLTPDEDGKPRARLLDLVPGRSGKAYSDWLEERGDDFKNGVEVATLDPFHGYKNAIDDQLEDAVAVLDAFHVVKLGTQAVDEVRRRVQQEIHGHRGRKNDPLYGIRTILRCGQEKLTERQRARLDRAIVADERHDEVLVAWLCAQQLRSAYKAKNPVEGRRIAEKVLASLPTCPIPEIKRLGKTLKQWREAFLAYFDTGRANNGGTEAINGAGSAHARELRGPVPTAHRAAPRQALALGDQAPNDPDLANEAPGRRDAGTAGGEVVHAPSCHPQHGDQAGQDPAGEPVPDRRVRQVRDARANPRDG